MSFQNINVEVKRNLEAIGIIGMDTDGNFEFSDAILDDDMDEIEKQGLKMLKPLKTKTLVTKKQKKQITKSVAIKSVENTIPKKYSIQFTKNETEEAELVWATMADLGVEVEIKDIFNFVMTKGFTSEDKLEIRKIASSRILEEKLSKYLKDNKLKMDKEEVLLHLLSEKLQ
ncbi:hypothetical protein A9Q84_02110 [Halobacteriovorax marinus]|uniref:Uncharacterized protein n=1 Tax=Halobacteriovorax marinus TaxID=97084 RepID=A0A1Y5FI21_9BACT|nr:hypothetical protein A9Q84_02110 [Halobacteriovorax marinus]